MPAPVPPVLRFAPSPNGRLHLGHAYSALFTAYWAKMLGGTLRLRIEDIDVTRCKPGFITAILDDLEWLGIEWAEPVLRQSQRFTIYEDAAASLKRHGLLYPCFCTRADIAARSKGKDPDGAPLYPGTCKGLSADEATARMQAGERAQWRLDSAAATARTGLLTFTTAQPAPNDRQQVRYARPERWGDVTLVRKEVPTSYHLSVVVDDALEGVTHVTRGRDLEAATDIHVLVQFLLGYRSPVYTHHRLIADDAGLKLAKSRGSPSLADLRKAGVTAGEVRGRLGF